MHVWVAVFHDEGAIAGWETVAVEDEGVKQLPCCRGHEKPGAEPPWSILEVPEVFELVVDEFECAREDVDCDCDAQLGGGVDREEEACEGGAERRC